MITSVRATYLTLISHVTHLLASPEITAAWIMPDYSVAGLAGHLVRGVRAAERAIQAAPPEPTHLMTPAEYWNAALDADDSSLLNAGLRERGELLGSEGHQHVLAELDSLLPSLTDHLTAEPNDRIVTVLDGLAMRLDGYLVTRIVELIVHADDLATSVGTNPDLPPAAIAIAIDNLIAVARSRHGDLAILRALSRRERQTPNILRVF